MLSIIDSCMPEDFLNNLYSLINSTSIDLSLYLIQTNPYWILVLRQSCIINSFQNIIRVFPQGSKCFREDYKDDDSILTSRIIPAVI